MEDKNNEMDKVEKYVIEKTKSICHNMIDCPVVSNGSAQDPLDTIALTPLIMNMVKTYIQNYSDMISDKEKSYCITLINSTAYSDNGSICTSFPFLIIIDHEKYKPIDRNKYEKYFKEYLHQLKERGIPEELYNEAELNVVDPPKNNGSVILKNSLESSTMNDFFNGLIRILKDPSYDEDYREEVDEEYEEENDDEEDDEDSFVIETDLMSISDTISDQMLDYLKSSKSGVFIYSMSRKNLKKMSDCLEEVGSCNALELDSDHIMPSGYIPGPNDVIFMVFHERKSLGPVVVVYKDDNKFKYGIYNKNYKHLIPRIISELMVKTSKESKDKILAVCSTAKGYFCFDMKYIWNLYKVSPCSSVSTKSADILSHLIYCFKIAIDKFLISAETNSERFFIKEIKGDVTFSNIYKAFEDLYDKNNIDFQMLYDIKQLLQLYLEKRYSEEPIHTIEDITYVIDNSRIKIYCPDGTILYSLKNEYKMHRSLTMESICKPNILSIFTYGNKEGSALIGIDNDSIVMRDSFYKDLIKICTFLLGEWDK